MRHHRHFVVATTLLLVLASASGCQKGTSKDGAAGSGSSATATGSGSAAAPGAAKGSGSGSGSAAAPVDPMANAKDIDSKDILARTETAPEVYVKHVLLGWDSLATAHGGGGDPRAAKRTNEQAAQQAQEIAGKLKANPDQIDALVKESSEDPGSLGGDPYTVKADTPFVPEFKKLALRLKEKEVGIVRTQFGYHIIERVEKPKPDPLESADILAREPTLGGVHVQHILIGWKDTPVSRSGQGDKRGAARTKEEADKVATDVLAKVRAKGSDMAKLMKELSEDPSSKDTARVFEMSGNVPQGFESFKNLSARLKIGEAGLAKTTLGWHIIKRVPAPPPPPPDSLESADILKRDPVTQKAKVKHILLGWKDMNPQDERAKKRDRAELEKLVKATIAKLKKGDKIEPLMSELSEDPGSAKSGNSYDVTPDAGLVPPFKDLSLRLKVGEVGAVKTNFGIHIIQRTE